MNNAVSIYVKRMAEGVALQNEKVKVLLFTQNYGWSETSVDGLIYLNSLMGTRRSGSKIIRGLIYYYRTFFSLWGHIKKLKRDEGLNCVLHVSESDSISVNLMLACRTHGITYIANILEHPMRRGRRFSNLASLKLMRILSSGNIYISQNLQTALPHKHSIVVPPTVESARLQRMPDFPDESSKFTIGYCGTISNYKDGFDILLASLRHVKGDLQRRIRLLVIGDSNRKEETLGSFERGVADSGMEIEVQFTGRIENSEVMNFLTDCNLLVLTRPDNLQTRYGFPSKLPEYLSTGRPVLVSKVSDIPGYLKNGVSAYLLDEVSPSTVAGKIEYIMQNYAEATEVGRRGYEVAKAVFNNEVQGRRVVEFCRNPQGVK